MRITDLRAETTGGKARIMADVVWEDCGRAPVTVYYETDEAFSEALTCDAHVFLLGCAIPARRYGEQRIAISEEVSPELAEGLEIVMRWLDAWQGKPIKPLLIEAKKGNRMPAPWGGERAGAFVSGGLDSLAMLKANRNRYPPEHPRYIRDGLIVHGFDIGGRAAHDAEAEAFEQALDTLSAVAADAGLTLIPVRTNVRHLDDNVDFWIHEFDGAALASVAHAFSNRLSTISVASGHEVPDIEYGDSPVLMANYSSTDLLIRLENLTLSRLARASLIAEWDVALKNLRVCTLNPPGRLNCGQCEKCIRTMTELVALGKLTETEAFGVHDVSVDLLETVESTEPNLEQYFRELIEPLEQRGRHDLAAVIERKLSEYERHLAWQEERDWKGVIKRFDRKRLGSSLFRAYSAIRSLRRGPAPARTRVKA